jgi:hypothetical protein
MNTPPSTYVGNPQQLDASFDITGGFFKYEEDQVLFNMVVANLNKDIPEGINSKQYRFNFTHKAVSRWVRALIDDAGTVTFNIGTGNTIGAAVPGALFLGKDGVVQIAVPDIQADEKVKITTAITQVSASGGGANVNPYSPDTANGGPEFTAAPCAPPAGGGGGGGGENPPAGGGGGGGQNPPPGGGGGEPPAGGQQGGDRTASATRVTLSTSDAQIRLGEAIVLSGNVDPAQADREVQIRATTARAKDVVVATVKTDAGGNYTTKLKPTLSTSYVAKSGNVDSNIVAVVVEKPKGLARLKINFSKFGGSARNITRARSITVKVRAAERVRKLVAMLRFGSLKGKVVGRGHLGVLRGKGVLKVRITAKLKPGKYFLVVNGVDARDQRGMASARLRFS